MGRSVFSEQFVLSTIHANIVFFTMVVSENRISHDHYKDTDLK